MLTALSVTIPFICLTLVVYFIYKIIAVVIKNSR